MSESNRKKTARNTFYDINLAEFLDPYEEIAKAYNDLYFIKKQREKQAYLVTFADDPSIIFVSFATHKERSKARYEAVRYFKNSFHPHFMGGDDIAKDRFINSRLLRYPQFDKYAKEGRVPITELFKLGIRIPCCNCGKGSFNQALLNLKQCYILEGEGNLNGFTKGILLCKACYDNLMGKHDKK